eukprot:snap_masked-scaffold_61-processed-gene-0.45-mRNA-1 protein AED:0.99 eAED:1.00 QI:0/0/0/0.5/1/1/2/0/285
MSTQVEDIDGNDFDPNENPGLFFGVLSLSAFMFLVAFVFLIQYFKQQKRAHERQREINERLLAPVDLSGWVNTQEYNGNENINSPQLMNFFENDIPRSDLKIETKEQFQSLLELYYSHHAPQMTQNDILVVVEMYFSTSELQNELDTILENENGEIRVQQQTLRRRKNIQRRGIEGNPAEDSHFPGFEQPSVNFLAEKPMAITSEGVELSLRGDLKTALERRGLGKYFDILQEQGVQNISDMRNIREEELVEIVSSEEDLTRLLEICTNANLLFIAEMNDPKDIL